jgi:hypothetical protein
MVRLTRQTLEAMTSRLSHFVDALHEIAHDAGRVLLGLADPGTAGCAALRYNAVCLRLIDLLPAVATVYRPLPVQTSPGTLRLAARDVAAFVLALPDPHRLRRRLTALPGTARCVLPSAC